MVSLPYMSNKDEGLGDSQARLSPYLMVPSPVCESCAALSSRFSLPKLGERAHRLRKMGRAKMRYLALGLSTLAAVTASAAHARAPRFETSIVRTAHGIPHVTATNWRGIGYGVGYAYAQDNLCMLAEEFVTVAGERSLHFGPGEKASVGFDPIDNLSSDTFFRAVIDLPTLRRTSGSAGVPANQMRAGYVAGYNRLLRDLGATNVPVACRGKAWLRPITGDDMLRLGEKQALLAGSLALATAIANAAPPSSASRPAQGAELGLPSVHETGVGSNGWAFGSETTANGRGVLVGNPHFPWNGPSRFYQMHVTIPGVIDVMGAGLGGTPLPTIGFNKDIAWTHTVTAARHFTIYELTLDPADPTSYIVDGKSEKMTSQTLTIPMPEGAPTATRTLYASRFGHVLAMPAAGLGWSKDRAFAVRDANANNQRLFETWVAIGQARTTNDVRGAVEKTLGIPWVNTIAADRAGNALLADVTAVPYVSAQKIAACATPRSAPLAQSLVLLDGSRAACDWDKSPGTAVAGLMPAADQAVFMRRDYVANSNDSYWLTNASAPATPLSPILGAARTERSLRTRSGLLEIQRRFAGTDGLTGTRVDQANARNMVFANKSLAVELTLDKVIALCTGQADLVTACEALRKWDRRFDVDSRGAYLFMAFWDIAAGIRGKWAIPFDVNDPVNTPRDLITDGEIGTKLIAALRSAAARLELERIALDARWGDVQFAVRRTERIAIHGAHGNLGVLNVQMSDKVSGGLVPRHGSSYIQVVSFDETGPVADAILSYSQSTDPASPWYADQTRDYSTKTWNRLPFTPAQVQAAAVGVALQLRE
jgi:acyl-homoserine-lactone acylase